METNKETLDLLLEAAVVILEHLSVTTPPNEALTARREAVLDRIRARTQPREEIKR